MYNKPFCRLCSEKCRSLTDNHSIHSSANAQRDLNLTKVDHIYSHIRHLEEALRSGKLNGVTASSSPNRH